jgi:carboxyl-terminal processing protease
MAAYLSVSAILAAVFFPHAGLLAEKGAEKEPDPAQVTITVASLLEQVHFSKQRLNKDVSRKLLRNYLETLDYNHLFFSKEDVDGITDKWADSLDSEIIFGRTVAAQEIHALFKKRVEERVAFAKEVLAGALDFESDHFIDLNRQKLQWPAAGDATETLWKDRITSEVIQERLNKSPKEPVATVGKRYNQYLRDIREQTSEDVVKLFLLSLARTYDPHSDYMSKSDQEQFNISMRLSLFGIGARLRSEDGYTKVDQLIPGGPASRVGKMKAGDRIVGVAQGEGEFVDCVDMKLDKVVAMIRGDKDTIVRLQLIPVNATNGSERTVVEIKRDEIKLKEGDAHAELIEWVRPDGSKMKLGYIDLPSFYRDFSQNGNPNAKSTTRDVLMLLNRLKKEGIEGLVMDFRRDGGGSLEEAINLSGLFIKDGPVVQVKSWNGEVSVNRDTDPTIAYDGPMVVLVNRQSASASEIFAAAMQDYGRAVVVGDSKTFGKGTVQQMIELSKAVPTLANGGQAGAVKLTIQKFYRIAGGSTQLRGVESDIVLPSTSDQPEMGESALKDPLPYDTIKPLVYDRWSNPIFIEQLKQRSLERIPKDPEFTYVLEDVARIRKYVDENKLSTNEKARREEVEKDKARNKKREEERAARSNGEEPKAFRITLDNVTKGELLPITFVEPKTPKEGEPEEEQPKEPLPENGEETVFKTSPFRYDPVKAEGLNILGDFVGLSKGAEGKAVLK